MNQNSEQIARDNIDKKLLLCGWGIQGKKQIKLSAEIGVAIRKYQTEYANSELKYLNNATLPSAPDKTSSDTTWLKDKSLADLDKLSDPDILANDILENLEASLENFRSSIRQLK